MIAPASISVIDRLLEPVAACLTPEVARRIAELRADPTLQSRLDELAEKANSGTLSEPEEHEYQSFVDVIDFIGVLQAKARLVLQRTNPV